MATRIDWEVEDLRGLFAGLPCFNALDDEVADFLAGMVAGDPIEEEATFEESLGPFLEDSGAGDWDGGVEGLCGMLRGAMTGARPGAEAAAAAPPQSEAMQEGTIGVVCGTLGVDASTAAQAAARAVIPPTQGAVGGARQPTEGIDELQRRRAEASWQAEDLEPTVSVVMRSCVGDVDADVLSYVCSIVADDAGESEAAFEDTIGPLMLGSVQGLEEHHVGELCTALRAALDATLAGSAKDGCWGLGLAPGPELDAGAPRKLAGGPVMLGDLDDGGEDDGVVGSCLQAHLASKAKREDQRIQQRLNAREKEAEKRRAAAEAKAQARARAAASRVEELTAKSYAAETTVSQRGRSSGAANSRDIHVMQFNLPSHGGGQNLLESTMLRLMHGHRYGLVGRNGMGKSTLLACLAAGRMGGIPSGLRILHVAQDSADRIVAGSRTEGVSALEAVVQSDTRREELLQEVENATGNRLSEVYEALEAIDADSAPARAAAILRGLQFSDTMMHQPVASLSGGWRMRVSIAAALFQEPDVLLLDEPTNHLDLEAVLWLGDHLEGWGDKTLVVVSHDRSFLNEVCTDIIHLENRALTYYQGGFDTFEAVRDERRHRQQRIFEQQEAKKKEMELFVQKHLHKGQSLVKDDAAVKQAKKVAKQIERIGVAGQDGKKYKQSYDGPQVSAELPEEEKGLSSFMFPVPDVSSVGVATIQVKDVMFRYPGAAAPIFTDLNFNVDLKTRCALLGRNGCGKSTFVSLLSGRLEPTIGEVHRSHHLRVAAFTQHHMEQLNLDQSPLEHLLEHGRVTEPTLTPDEVRRRIGRFGMSGHWQTQRIRTLSGGQKSRVAFCKATWSSPHVLLLDEPTNHLDLDSVDFLIEAVKAFPGGIICVSHDQHFLSSITEEYWIVGEGPVGMKRLDGRFQDYKKAMLRSLRKKAGV